MTPTSGHDVVTGGFDHIAFEGGIMPDQVRVTDTPQGALVTWGTDASLLLEGVKVADMWQDDFMFNEVERGGFVNNSAISTAGTDFIFF